MINKNEIIKLREKQRVYHFPNNETVVLNNVVELIVRESGTHRVKTEDKKLHVIPTGWIHIEINEEEWTV
ncbi:hypothetical protein [Exiguobacterium sp. s193]|uniref:hypothetical protein n=1 Tax=Exiguobacterium sp. s193 TaxID=2751207 RepID=UPI001BE8DB65|nr:hypothetical protein [Exiguobacterium sp. s193]